MKLPLLILLLLTTGLCGQNNLNFSAQYAFEAYGNGEFIQEETDAQGNHYLMRRANYLDYTSAIQVYKTNANFELLWVTDLSPTGTGGAIYFLSAGNNGVCYAAFTSDAASSYDYLLYKLTDTGEIAWQKVLGSSGNDFGFFSVEERSDNTLIFAGEFDEIDGTFADSSIFHSYMSAFGDYSLWMTKYVVAHLDATTGNVITAFAPYESIYNMSLGRTQVFILSDNSYVILSGLVVLSEDPFLDMSTWMCGGQSSTLYQRYSSDHQLLQSSCIPELSIPSWEGYYSMAPPFRVNDFVYFTSTNSDEPPSVFVKLNLLTGESEVRPLTQSAPPQVFVDEQDGMSFGTSYNIGNCSSSYSVQLINSELQSQENYCTQLSGYSKIVKLQDGSFLFRSTSDLPNNTFGGCYFKFRLNGNISGKIYYDQNNNGIFDSNEFGLSNSQLNYSSSTGAGSINATPEGNYYLSVDTGTYNLYPISSPWFTVTSSPEIVNIASGYEREIRNFACAINAEVTELSINLVPEILVAGFEWQIQVVIRNLGTLEADAQFNLNVPPGVNYTSASVPSSIVGNSITLLPGTLQPFESIPIDITFTTSAPPALLPGDTLQIMAALDNLNDENSQNNISTAIIPVFSSYDPNDITHLRGNLVSLESTQAGEPFSYLIRCQNEGNYPTQFIHVRDTLPPELNWQSLNVKASSHPVQVWIDELGAVDWFFETIELSPASEDEINSKAWILFDIKPNLNLESGDVVKHTAHIYFDYNPAITTNTDRTYIDFYTGVQALNSDAFGIIPNPAYDLVTLIFEPSYESKGRVELVGIDGRLIQRQNIDLGISKHQMDVSMLTPGLYFIRLVDLERQITSSKKLLIMD